MTAETLLAEFDGLIQDMASYAFNKLKQPAVLDVEDLVQEGRIRAIDAVNRWWNPNRGASLKTFVYQVVVSKFSDIVAESYKSPEPEGEEAFLRVGHFHSPIEFCSLFETIRERMQGPELEYTILMLSRGPAKQQSFRSQVRKTMHLSVEEENRIRESIESKLLFRRKKNV